MIHASEKMIRPFQKGPEVDLKAAGYWGTVFNSFREAGGPHIKIQDEKERCETFMIELMQHTTFWMRIIQMLLPMLRNGNGLVHVSVSSFLIRAYKC